MSNYAMVVNGRVIEVLHDRETTPVWPPDKNGNSVRAICCDDSVERGMKYYADTNTFTFAEPMKLEDIETSQLAIMEAIADQYELNEERRIDDLEVQAEIYEAILELGGNL